MYNKLLDLREESDMTQTDISKIIGVSRSIISKWESGKEIIPLKHLNAYSNYFKVSFDYILELTNNKKKKVDFIELDTNIIGQRIKQFRKRFNLTLRDVAEELKTSSSTISAYETGKTLILTSFAYQLCKDYNISLDWLCGKTNKKEL